MTYAEILIPLTAVGQVSVKSPGSDNRIRVTIGGRRAESGRANSSAACCRTAKQTECAGVVTLYTDGACSGNPGFGGWSAILTFEDGSQLELSGGEEKTTNNRMELTAVIQGLHLLMTPHEVHIYTDSQYVVKTMTEGWQRNKNLELWAELDNLAALHDLHFHWVRGHSGDPYNERCDAMAKVEIAKLIERKLDHPGDPAPATAG